MDSLHVRGGDQERTEREKEIQIKTERVIERDVKRESERAKEQEIDRKINQKGATLHNLNLIYL